MDGAVYTPLLDELVCDGRLEVGGRVAVLGEELGEVLFGEEGREFEDVGEGDCGHGEEDVLHINDEKRGLGFARHLGCSVGSRESRIVDPRVDMVRSRLW